MFTATTSVGNENTRASLTSSGSREPIYNRFAGQGMKANRMHRLSVSGWVVGGPFGAPFRWVCSQPLSNTKDVFGQYAQIHQTTRNARGKDHAEMTEATSSPSTFSPSLGARLVRESQMNVGLAGDVVHLLRTTPEAGKFGGGGAGPPSPLTSATPFG